MVLGVGCTRGAFRGELRAAELAGAWSLLPVIEMSSQHNVQDTTPSSSCVGLARNIYL